MSSGNEALDSILEYAKIRIKSSHLSKQRILITCIYNILDSVPRDYLQRVLEVVRQRDDCQEDLIDIACICVYGLSCGVQSACVVLKEYHRECLELVKMLNGNKPAYTLYGEALIHLALGILSTESLSIISRIKKDTLLDVLFMVHDTLYGEYQGVFLSLLENSNTNSQRDEERLIQPINQYFGEIQDRILELLKNQTK